MWADFRFALRVLRRFRLYTFASTATLALGVGATTAVFGVIDATLLRPLPFSDPDRLVALNSAQRDPDGSEQPFPPSQIELLRWRAAGSTLEAIEALESRTMALTGEGEPEVVNAALVTSGLFPMLGVNPALGHVFSSDEERGNAPVVMLSHALWARRFNSDPSVLGRSITLGGRSYNVVGVMPESLRLLLDRSEIWMPMNPVVDPARQNNRFMVAVGRLRHGATALQAQSELAAISATLAREFPLGHSRARPVVTSLHDKLFGQRGPALWMLGIAVLGLLALSCANVANLTLGHLSIRKGELATRALLGAGRWQMVRMLFVQTGAMAVAGGFVGLLTVRAVIPPLIDLYNADGLGVVTLGIDWRVLSLAIFVIGGTTIFCSVIPALRVQRSAARGDAVRLAAARVSAGPLEMRTRAALVALQIAIAVALLCASGTFLRSLNSLLATSPGFSSDHVLTMQMMLPPTIYSDATSRAGFVRRMLERVQAVPGVIAAGTTQSTFLPGQSMRTMMAIEGLTMEEPEISHIRHITPGYFGALRVPIIEGRPIDMHDQMGQPPVCMVSQAFSKKYFPKGDVLGRRVRRTGPVVLWMTIVGVVGDVKDDGLAAEPSPLLYVPYLQVNTATARVSLVVRTTTEPMTMVSAVRQAVWDIDRNQPMDRVLSLESVIMEGASAERFRTLLVALFALVGLTLAVIGVYAVTSASVTARMWETSLRLALGARPLRIVAGMILEAMRQAVLGIVAGVATFCVLGRLLSSLLFRTSAAEASVIAGAVVGTLTLVLLAVILQARRLASVSPALGLRGRDAFEDG